MHGQYRPVHVERDVDGRDNNALQAEQRNGDVYRPWERCVECRTR